MSTCHPLIIAILITLVLGTAGLVGAAPTQTMIAGTVTLQARPSSAGVMVLYDGIAVATTSAAGAFSFGVEPGGAHILTARAPGHITRRLFLDDPNGALTLPPTTLRLGDADGDDDIDLSDAIIVSSAFNSTPPSDTRADLNRDGKVDITDMVAVASNYGLRGPMPWLEGSALVWSTRAGLTTPRYHLGVVESDGLIYAVGGCCDPSGGSQAVLDRMEVYTPLTNTWTPRAALPMPRAGLGLAAVNGKLYAIGGTSAVGKPLARVDEYDPKTDTWTPKHDMPTPRTGLAVAVLDGKVYAIGGEGDQVLGAVEVYDPTTDSWTNAPAMPTPRVNFAAVARGGKVYALGGWGTGGHLATVEVYDPATGAWTTGPPLLAPRSDLAAAVSDGKIYALGGFSDGAPATPLNLVEVFEPTVGWTKETGMSQPRLGLGVAAIDGKLFAIGGYGLGYLASVEEASPVSAQHK